MKPNFEATAPAATGSVRPPADTHPVDLVHLSRQTMSDRGVEREVLRLFLRQAAIQLNRLSNARDNAERCAVAHTIVGAARGIGAWPVARSAAAVEQADDDAAAEISQLTLAIADATSYIELLLGEARG